MVVIKTMEKKLLAILILSMSLLVSIMAAKSQMGMETNIDRPGMNYNNYPLSSADPQICANDCANDPNCNAFTYVKPGFREPNSPPECWLKKGVPDPVPQKYCTSGIKAEATIVDWNNIPGQVLHLFHNVNQAIRIWNLLRQICITSPGMIEAAPPGKAFVGGKFMIIQTKILFNGVKIFHLD